MNVLSKGVLQLNWVDLLPDKEKRILANPPKSLTSIPDGSALDILPSKNDGVVIEQGLTGKPKSPEEAAYYTALRSVNINEDLNNKTVRIPGYIVPVEVGKKQTITEFFLVPYFGACLHIPPPPPNQIIYVRYPKGISLKVLYDPFWIEGKMYSKLIENDMASSAYAIEASSVTPYTGEYQRSKAIQNKG